MTASLPTCAIRAEPDAFDISRPRLMGRHTAGHGFLRAAVAGRGDHPVYGYSPSGGSRAGFEQIVRQIDPAARTELIEADHLHRLSEPGALYLGDAMLPTFARLRLRQGMTAFSLCGVTHTTATHVTMDAICDLLHEPVAPWDALICTSSAVVETVRRLHEAQADYLRWRLGAEAPMQGVQLPVIPLGVHCEDFVVSEAERAAARAALGLEPDEVTGLYVGRLLFHGKAHPQPMYEALQAAAERTGKRVALILCGWAPNDAIDRAFRDGAAKFAPDVRTLFVDGREPEGRAQAWASGDVFFSLADNIQETFGLTPIEAKAAGMPVVVTDWNGYRDTVREGVDGFRITTWAPGAGAGQPIARAFESGAMTYDLVCWATGASTAVERPALYEAVTALVRDPELRRRMGEAGRRHARETYDWAVVYRQYQELWAELAARRAAAEADPQTAQRWAAAPRAAASRMDPFKAFGHYPTSIIAPRTAIRLAPGATRARLADYLVDPLYSQLTVPPQLFIGLMDVLEKGEATLSAAAAALGAGEATLARAVGVLAKMGIVDLAPAADQRAG